MEPLPPPASAWLSPRHCSHLGREQIDAILCCFTLSLFQINQSFNNTQKATELCILNRLMACQLYVRKAEFPSKRKKHRTYLNLYLNLVDILQQVCKKSSGIGCWSLSSFGKSVCYIKQGQNEKRKNTLHMNSTMKLNLRICGEKSRGKYTKLLMVVSQLRSLDDFYLFWSLFFPCFFYISTYYFFMF